jgi:hypothetical protein
VQAASSGKPALPQPPSCLAAASLAAAAALQLPPRSTTLGFPPQQCGWCGAINEYGVDPAPAPPPARGATARTLRVLGPPLRWLVVGLVVALIASVAGVGIAAVLPRAFPQPAAYAANAGFALALLTLTVWAGVVALGVAAAAQPGACARHLSPVASARGLP